jgi:hypothetical protein
MSSAATQPQDGPAPVAQHLQPPLREPCRLCGRPCEPGRIYCSSICQARQLVKDLLLSARTHAAATSDPGDQGKAEGIAAADRVLDALLGPCKDTPPLDPAQRRAAVCTPPRRRALAEEGLLGSPPPAPGQAPSKRAQLATWFGVDLDDVAYLRTNKGRELQQWEGAGWYIKELLGWRKIDKGTVTEATTGLPPEDEDLLGAFKGGWGHA